MKLKLKNKIKNPIGNLRLALKDAIEEELSMEGYKGQYCDAISVIMRL